MAEANPPFGEEREYFLSSSIEKLECQAECVKCEMNTKLDNFIEIINKERKKVLSEIDDELSKARDELKKYEKRTSARLSTKERIAQDLEGDDELLSRVNHEIEEEVSKKPELYNFKIQWNPNFTRICEDAEKIGHLKIYSQSRFEDSNRPLWSSLNRGKADNEVGEAKAVAVDPDTSNIYVGDASAGKILVLNKGGEYLNTLKFKKPSSIREMTICQNYIYCTSNGIWVNTIYRFDKNTGELVSKYNNKIPIDAFTAAPNQVFICCLYLLYVLPPDLKGWTWIKLKWPHKNYNNTCIRSIKCIKDELVMLTVKGPNDNPIQVFDKTGIFLRSIAEDLPILSGLAEVCMCIDDKYNILLSIRGHKQVNIYSKDGIFISSVDERENASDGFYFLRGIALDKDGTLLVCNNRSSNILQAY